MEDELCAYRVTVAKAVEMLGAKPGTNLIDAVREARRRRKPKRAKKRQ